MPIQLSHVLICRTDNIGDVVLTLPLAGYLKQLFPNVRIDFMCRSYAAPVVRQCAFVDRVIGIDSQRDNDKTGNDSGGDPAALIAAGGYDTVIFAFPDRRLARAARRAGIANRVGTSHRLYHWFTCNRLAHFSRVRSPLHEAQLNFALLRPLGIEYAPTLAQIPPLYGLVAPPDAEVALLREQAPFNLILHPKSNGNGREWPLERYTELALLLQAQPGMRLWITGGPAEGALLARDAAALLAMPNVVNLCGRFDLAGLCALIGAADGVIASGTGPLHMAAALGRPTLGLFPPIKPIDPARWGALGAQAQSMVGAPQCASCTGVEQCACMRAISAQQVAAVVLQWHAKAALAAPARAVL